MSLPQLVPLARPPQLLDPWLAPDVLSSAEAVTIVPNSRPTSPSGMCSLRGLARLSWH